ncbi:galactoside O-acetyltransferase [Phocaeicola salanitronis DSM 18170]|uniref:Galactoside O-acetyltransferase n=1 Tax=Phocaeicola salanitronis (strain DSM 18170 / JCM 13657 / CCUG 60908 / BL78) TaxID=667015 RepID=F0R0E6_PHOSB|nr:acyltransferase [Phocaeicola salanitronis]ADY37290.1 galactoside O-acetyltransferase [Phocaeicola salanitronis DSM 18170]
MNILQRIKHGLGIFIHYYVKPNPSRLGYFGKGAMIGIPADLKKPENIFLYDFARIGRRSTIMTMGDSKFVMKRGCLTAEGLVVVTSNHRQYIGQFLSGRNEDNEYKDIIVEEDVWIGINVTLLAGSRIGRGAIIGACSVVTKEIPPYAVAVGNPAKVIKFKWSIDEIMEHERQIYDEKDRMPRELLERNYQKWLNKSHK